MTSNQTAVIAADKPSPKPRLPEPSEPEAEPSVQQGQPRPWHKRARARLAIYLAAVIVVLAAVNGVLWWQAGDIAVVDRAASSATAAARKAVPTVLSYDYKKLEDYPARATAETTGRFATALGELIDSRVLPAAKRKHIVTRSTVQAVSTVSAEPDSVVLLMFVNQTTRTKDSAAPKLEGSRLRVSMRQVDDRWLISELKPV